MGVIVTVLYIFHLMEWFDTTPEVCTMIYCDNQEAVSFTNHRWLGSTPKWADTRNIDLKQILSHQLKKWDKCIRIEHVKGHQDKGVEYKALPLPAKLNVICDRECTKKIHPPLCNPQHVSPRHKQG